MQGEWKNPLFNRSAGLYNLPYRAATLVAFGAWQEDSAMWFTFSLIALLCWSGSDLFSKIGCQDAADKYSHLKMVMAVGVVMGLHATGFSLPKAIERRPFFIFPTFTIVPSESVST